MDIFMYRKRRRKRKKYTRIQQLRLRKYMKVGIVILLICMVVLAVMKMTRTGFFGPGEYRELADSQIDATKPEMEVDLLTVNEYSRPGIESNEIQGIVIHYTANPGATAKQNRDYFEGLKDSHITKASSHFVVGIEGEIVQCIPTWEVAYASNDRNLDTVSIECCHPDESGVFTEETYRSMVQLTAWLCEKFGLSQDDVIRHYDVTGKICPKYFVEDEEAWVKFKKDVGTAMMTE